MFLFGKVMRMPEHGSSPKTGRGRLPALSALVAVLLLAAAPALGASIYGISLERHSDRERLVFQLSQPATPQIESFTAPARVVVGFSNAQLGLNVRDRIGALRGEYIQSVEIYQFGAYIQFVVFLAKSADIQLVGAATETVLVDFLSRYRVSDMDGADSSQPAWSPVPSYMPATQPSAFPMADPVYADIDRRLQMEAGRLAATAPPFTPAPAPPVAPATVQPFTPATAPPPAAIIPSATPSTAPPLPARGLPMTAARAYDRFADVHAPMVYDPEARPSAEPKPLDTRVASRSGPMGVPVITIDFVDTELRDALKLIADAGGINIVLSSEVYAPRPGETEPPRRLVNLTLRDVPAKVAFEMALRSQGLWHVPREGVHFVTTEAGIVRDFQQIDTAVIQLQYADAVEVRNLLSRMKLDPAPQSIDVYLPSGSAYGSDAPGAGGLRLADSGDRVSSYRTTRRELPGDQIFTTKSNRLVVRGSMGAIEGVRSIVRQLDVAPRQVIIEATVVEINVGDLEEFGLSQEQVNPVTGQIQPGAAAQTGQTLAVFEALLPPGDGGLSVFLGGSGQLLSDNIDMVLKALLQQNKAKILNNPTIATLDGQPAVIEIGQDFPIISRDQSVDGGVLTTNTDLSFRRIGMSLYVTPRIDTDTNRITLAINPVLSDLEGILETFNPDGSLALQTPIVNVRETNTIVRVANGEKVYIGGLMRQMDQMLVTKVPLLGDMPVLGRFFRRQQETKVRQEVVIVLTPHVVDDLPIRR